ncbi:MAG: CsiV family protein [Pseudomonadota bacterium]
MRTLDPGMRGDDNKGIYLLVLCCLVMVLSASPKALAEAPIYDVEVIVFSNLNLGDGGERWPTMVRNDINVQEFVGTGEVIELPESSHQLGGISYSLRQSQGYSVLFHKAWRQPAYDSRNAIAYPVDTSIRSGSKSLSGQIKLVRERYLHLDVDLLLGSARAATELSYSEDAGGSPVYQLSEKRRIKKSGKVHYFDHPRFGMIAIVTPYRDPELDQQLQEEAAMEAAAAAEESVVEEEPLPEDDQLTR